MYKLLIVDDEYMIVEGLKKLIDQQSLGIEIVYTAYMAEDALRYVKKNPVDIVLTDISMPEITGLEMIERLQEMQKNIVYIVMSGYEEFEYARKAISLNVKDYLVKPIDHHRLNEILANIIKDKRRENAIATSFLRGKDVLLQHVKDSLDCDKLYFVAELREPQFARVSTLRQIDKHSVYFSLYDQKPNHDVIYYDLVSDNTDMYHMKEQIKKILFYQDGVITSSNSMPTYREYYELIQAGDVKRIVTKLPDLKTLFLNAKPKVNLTKQFFVQLVVNAYQQLNKVQTGDIDVIAQELNECQSFDRLMEMVEEKLLKLIDLHQYNSHVKQVLHIIKKEYRQELTLKSVSERLFISAVYLGQIIKKETGTTFSELLNQERIKASQTLLLQTDDTIEDICFKVGYSNVGYFYKIFKRLCHESPKSYREQIRK